MQPSFAIYNVKRMERLFDPDGSVNATGDESIRSGQLAKVFETDDAGVIGIVEGPIRDELLKASDHFPISASFEL